MLQVQVWQHYPVGDFVVGAKRGNLVRRAEMENYGDTAEVDYVRHLSHSSFTRGTIETALAAGLAFSGINQILNERRMSKLEKK